MADWDDFPHWPRLAFSLSRGPGFSGSRAIRQFPFYISGFRDFPGAEDAAL
jgi:hypothetical protein